MVNSNAPIVPGNQLYLERLNVHELLEQAVESPLVTVIAGAGYGKTYGVYSFLQKYRAVTAWMQISERDNFEVQFWENFVRTIAFISERSAAQLRETGFPATKRQFERYVSVPYTDIVPDVKYIFVYDDFHHIRNKGVLRFFERSMASPFSNITSILISRTEPDICLTPLFSKGLLAKITEDDLRFNRKEMTDYFAMQDIRLSPEAEDSLYRDTEGWAFAIHLAGLSLKKGAESPEYARSLMKRNIFNLIETELFAGISGRLQRYLVKLSLIEHWPLELLNELAENSDVVEEMRRIGTLVRYDTYLNAYRIHPLLLQYLIGRQDMLAPAEKKNVYIKTGTWCLKHNLKFAAVSCYEKAGDYNGVIKVAYMMPMVMARDIARFLLDITARAPKSAYERDATMHVLYVRLLMTIGHLEEALKRCLEVIAQFEAMPPSAYSHRVLFGMYTNLGFHGLITCLYTERYDFNLCFERASLYFPTSGLTSGISIAIDISSYLCRVGASEKGHIEQFICGISRSIPFVSSYMDGCMTGYDDLAHAEAAYFQEEMDAAEKHALTAIFKARKSKQYEVETRSLFYLLRIHLAFGNCVKIQEVLKELSAQLNTPAYINRYVLYDIITGWYYAQIGQFKQLPKWLTNEFEASDLNSLVHGLETLVKLKYLLSEKRYSVALAALENQTNRYGLSAFLFGKIVLPAMEAVCWYQLRKKEKAYALLKRAYGLSAPNELTMIFIELGKDMRALTESALKDGVSDIPRAWLEKISRKSAAYAKKLYTAAKAYEAQHGESRQEFRIEPLSRRETAILTGLSQGLTREEIADISALSVNTVKSIIKSVYAKLNAVNRADAIRIATLAGILKK
ncbi:MAG: LuxR C-terminal-related transcriptional regulator [Spirochaetaceae bacterium]|jgi:LuxR family maltose regulon positive regulatory protein|nr:LuxR C-terminal-related transcriptional regulator [Spirochaetaceae bacterium]